MGKNHDLFELAGASTICPTPTPAADCRSRRWPQDVDAHHTVLRAQVVQSSPESETPLGDVTAPPVIEPVIESATNLPLVAIGQMVPAAIEKAAPSRLQRFMVLLSSGEYEGKGCDADDERIIGSGDRAHHLALIAGTPVPLLQPRPAQRTPLITRPAPTSRTDCRRRCGKNGFCDPASALGCGGVHCGHPVLREPL